MIKINDKEFIEFANFIKVNFGLNLYKKKSLVQGRLDAMITSKGYSTLSEYLEAAKKDMTRTEMTELINKITTNYTFFMREEKHFHYLATKALPSIEPSIRDKDLRIWSAGCSTGEEPYTLAMVLSEYFNTRSKDWNTKILATDISVKALSKAERGIYSPESVKLLPRNLIARYFTKTADGEYEIIKDMKDEVIFRVFNLMDAVYPFKKKFHVIFCRNVMIYFDYETRVRLIDKLYRCLEPGGYLFIGHAEIITRNESKLQYVMPSIYKKEPIIHD